MSTMEIFVIFTFHNLIIIAIWVFKNVIKEIWNLGCQKGGHFEEPSETNNARKIELYRFQI